MFNRPIFVLLLLASLTMPAFAQPTPLIPSPTATPASAPTTAPATPPAIDRIQVQELANLNPNEIGLLDDQHGGLGTMMWSGSGLGLVSKALPMLPNQPGWRTLRALQLRLLESAATMPAGRAAGESLITVRIGKLASMGAVDAASALLRMLPGPSMTPVLRRLQAESALLSGDPATACAQDSALRASQANDMMTGELHVYCQFLAGKGNEAGLSVDLLRDQKIKDPLFFIATDALSGLPVARLEGLADLSPVTLAMVALAKLPLPEAIVANAPPAFLAAIARAPGTPVETRLLAAERAVGLGVVPADLLRQIDESLTLGPNELLSAAGELGKTPKSRALLYRAALSQPLASAKADLIERGLAADPASAHLLYAPMLAALPASPDLLTFAPWAFRALLRAGQTEAARPWLALLQNDLAIGTGGNAAAALKPLARLAGLGDAPLNGLDLSAWRTARSEPAADANRHTLLLLCLLAALGDPPPDEEWLALLDGPAVISGKMSRSALAVGLMSAVAAQRKGETVLYALLSLGDQRDVEPAEFGRLIGGLRAVGLDREARALALEVALAYGI